MVMIGFNQLRMIMKAGCISTTGFF